MPKRQPAAPALPPQTERSFQEQVLELAKTLGYRVHWTHDSRHSPAGWPDLVLCRARGPHPRVVFAELKAEDGIVSDAQTAWLDDLRACGLDARIWRPSDWDEIVEVLR